MKSSIRIVALIACLLGLSGALEAQCPFGDKVNCLGECGRFTDENGDSFCDFSKVENAQNTSAEQADTAVKETSPVLQEVQPTPAKPTQKEVSQPKEEQKIEPVLETENQTTQSETLSVQTPQPKKEAKQAKPYKVITISCICLGLYLLTFLLVKTGKMKKLTHRKIWNFALLITFLVSCLLGFLLALQLNYHFGMQWLRPILKLHVEFGIAMTIVALFHLIWHLKYYTKILKK